MSLQASNFMHLCGWHNDPAQVRAVMATLPHPVFAQAAPNLMGDGLDKDVKLYLAWKDVLKAYPAYPAQEIGDCFVAGTKVTMGDGTTKNIEDVAVGDFVISHRNVPRRVAGVLKKQYSGHLFSVAAGGLDQVTATADHQFVHYFEPGRKDLWKWTRIEHLQKGDRIIIPGILRGSVDPSSGAEDVDYGVSVPITFQWVRRVKDTTVFCLSVEEDHSFMANGYGSHNCTSFGMGHAVDLLQCVQIVIGHKAEAYKESCTEEIYGNGRAIANMLGYDDGCTGAAVAKGVVEKGVVPREVVGPYDGKRAKSWGATGVPADVQTKAGEHKVKTVSLVSSWAELCAALANGYPVTVASDQGFTMTRDANGLCQPRGSWNHQMMIAGVLNSTGAALICQSWGSDVPDGPLALDQPSFSFWAPKSTIERMLGQQDSWAVSSFDGYPGQPLPSEWTHAGWSGF